MDLDNIQRKYGLPAPLPVVQNGKFAPRFPLNLEHRGDDVFQFGGKYIGEIENIYDLLYKILTNQEIDASLALPYAIKITEDKLYVRDKTNSEWILIFDITKPNFPKEIELYELIYKAITHQVIGEDISYPGQFKIEENILYVRDKDNLTWTQIGDVTKEFLGATEATQAILEQVNKILTEVQELKIELNRQIATTNETLTTALKAANEAMTSAQSINIRTFNSVEEMKASNTLKAGALAKTLGFYIAGDGGGADYVITNDIGKDETDEASIIALQNELYAKLIIKDYINVKQMGAKGDGEIDDTEAIQKSFNIGSAFVPSGTFIVTKQLTINKNNFKLTSDKNGTLKYSGYGAGTSMYDGGEYILLVKECENIYLGSINIDCTEQGYKGGSSDDTPLDTAPNPIHYGLIGLFIKNCKNVIIEKCYLNDIYGDGIKILRSSNVRILNNTLLDCSAGLLKYVGDFYDNHGDGIVALESFNVNFIGNTVINTRTYKVSDSSGFSRDVMGLPCGRSGLEFHSSISGNTTGAEIVIGNGDGKGTGLIVRDNYVYGYTKGMHMENFGKTKVVCTIVNNTFVYNHIGTICTLPDTIIDGNTYDSRNIGQAPQIGYNDYSCCIALANYYLLNYGIEGYIRVTNNNFYGGLPAVLLGTNKIVINNNLFNTDSYAIKNASNPIEDIIISNNIFRSKGENLPFINLYNTSEVTLDKNIFDDDNEENTSPYLLLEYFNSDITISNNVFNIKKGMDIAIKDGGDKFLNCCLINNVIDGIVNGTFISMYNPINLKLLNNVLKTNAGILFSGNSFFGVNILTGNIGGKAGNTNGLNTLFFVYNKKCCTFYAQGTVAKSLTGVNTEGTTGKICTQEGYGGGETWSSKVFDVGDYIIAGTHVYVCTVKGSSSSTVKPTHTEGTVSESDGYSWKYLGEKAIFGDWS